MDDALELILHAIKFAKGNEVFIPKLKSYVLSDLVNSLKELSKVNFSQKNISLRPGEKMHELLLNEYEIKSSIESNGVYILLPSDFTNVSDIRKMYPKSKPSGIERLFI